MAGQDNGPLAPLGCGAMPAAAFVERLNEQIGHEFAAHQQYVAVAVHYDGDTLPQLARFFYRQALEERDHAMMMVQYLLDADAPVRIPGVDAPRTDFSDIVEPIALALDQERRVTEQINALAVTARDAGDLTSEQFMQWFIKEQVEEVATMSDLLRVVRRSHENPMIVEDFLAREHGGAPAEDPTAPRAAGG
jgi:ferritin